MKRTPAFTFVALFSILAVAGGAIGAMFVMGKRRDAAQAAQIADLKATVAKQQVEIQKTAGAAADSERKTAQFAARAKAARQSLLEARNAAAAMSTPIAAADASPPADDKSGSKKTGAFDSFKDSIAKMMKDPAMKNMMRTTQSTVLRQMYGDLVKQWSLSPDETNTFYDLLLDKQMAGMDQGMAALENGSAPAGKPSADDPEAKLKASLGSDLYKQYQDYAKTIPARMTVSQFQQQLAVSNAPPLTADQSSVLLQTVTEEQAAQPPGSSFPTTGAGGSSNPFVFDEAHVDQMMTAQGNLNDKIDARMANTLSPDQLQVLKQQQQQMLATQKMGMQMAAKMMGPSATP